MSVISVQSLTRNYGNNKGIFDVSFAIEPGEVFGFLGPNGAGKTTTIRHLMGFLNPRQGQCRINGKDCWRQAAQIQQKLGYIPGEMAFPDDMTGTAFLKFLAHYRGMKNEGRMQQLTQLFQLDPRGRLKKMSKGMKQKIGIIAAFMHDPDVLILDEPTSGLDPLMQNHFIELILQEKQRGKTILMSSHMFEEVERTCERVGIIREGRLVAVDSVDALKAAQVKRYIITLSTPEEAAAFAADADVQAAGTTQNRVTVVVKNDIGRLVSAMGRYQVTNIAAPNQSLEDIFLHYYGGSNHV